MASQRNQIQTQKNEEAYKAHVILQELGAREAEAVWKKYFYTIEADKLLKEYNEVMKKNFELMKKQQEELEALRQQAEINATLLQTAVPE